MVRRILPLLAVAILATALASCTPAASGGPTGTSSPAATATAAAGAITIGGHVHAGPTCPAVRPSDPTCSDRPVGGAVLIVTTAAGVETARVTSVADGSFSVALPPGDYVLVPQPVTGLIGTAPPQAFHVQGDGADPAPLDVVYDTGIRLAS